MDAKTVGSKESSGKTNAVGFWEAFWCWVKLGFINFGGPAGQIAIMRKEFLVGLLSYRAFFTARHQLRPAQLEQ